MRRLVEAVAVAVVIALAGVGCGPTATTADGGDALSGADAGKSALRIATETIASAQVGIAYSQPLSATGGSPPYGWLIPSKPNVLGWLSIGSSTGILSGLPSTVTADGGVDLTVAVTDQNATTVTTTFSLTVAACKNGDTVNCTTVNGASCSVGSQTCVDGHLPATCTGTPSTSVATCGPTCGACGPTADRCIGGACACGTGSPCAAGQTCCGGACKSFDDVHSCGACGNDCTAQAGDHVSASCSAGQCAFACVTSATDVYQHCVSGVATSPGAGVACEMDIWTNATHCGGCAHDCTPTSNADTATAGCAQGVCNLSCAALHYDCNNVTSDGCEVPSGVSNCGGCGKACVAGAHQATADCPGGSCKFTCASGYGDCDKDQEKGNAGTGCETDLNAHDTCGSSCDTKVACSADQACSGGNCVCDASKCQAGTHCGNSGHCECNGGSCAGCCTAVVGGTCLVGTSITACGKAGGICAACDTTPVCGTSCALQSDGSRLCKGIQAGTGQTCQSGVCTAAKCSVCLSGELCN